MSAAFLTTTTTFAHTPLSDASRGSNSIRYGAKVNYLRNIFDNLSNTKGVYTTRFTDDQRQCRSARTSNDCSSRSRSSSVPCSSSSSDERNNNSSTSNESVVRFKKAKDLFEKLESKLNNCSLENGHKTTEQYISNLNHEQINKLPEVTTYSNKATFCTIDVASAKDDDESEGQYTNGGRLSPIILSEAMETHAQNEEIPVYSGSAGGRPLYMQANFIDSNAMNGGGSIDIPVETVSTVSPVYVTHHDDNDNDEEDGVAQPGSVIVYGQQGNTVLNNGVCHYDVGIGDEQDDKLIEQSDFLQPTNLGMSPFSSPDRVAQMKPAADEKFHSPDLLCEENFPFCDDCREAYDERGNSCIEIPGIPNISRNTNNSEDARAALTTGSSKRVTFSDFPIRVYETFSASDYDRRNDEIDPIGASAEYELEKRIEKMDVYTVDLEKPNSDDNLGFTIIGMGVGADAGIEKLGIFIKSINPTGIAAKDGRMEIGDQILEVNGNSLVGTTQNYAASLLKSAGGRVNFVMGREQDKENSEVMRLINESIQQEMESCDSIAVIHEDCMDNFTPVSVQTDDFFERNAIPRPDTRRKVNELENELKFLKQQMRSFETVMQQKNVLEKKAETYQTRCEELENIIRSMERERNEFQEQILFYQKQCYELEQKYYQARKLIVQDINERDNTLKMNTVNCENSGQLAKKTLEKPTKNDFKIMQPPARPPKRSPPPPQPSSSSGESAVSVTALNSLYDTPKMNKLDQRDNENSPSDSDSLSSLSRQPILDNEVLKMRSGLMKNVPRSRPTRRLSTEHSFPLVLESVSENDLICKNNESDDGTLKEFSRGINSLVESSRMLIAGNGFQATNSEEPKADALKHQNHVNGFQFKVQTNEWTVDDVIKWLSINGFGGHAAAFLERNVDGEKLLRLDNSKLKALGFKSSRDRDVIKAKIKELKETDRKNQRNLASSSHRNVMTSLLCKDK